MLVSCGFFKGLIHSMNIYIRLMYFLERKSSGECSTLLTSLCRNISDMVHGSVYTILMNILIQTHFLKLTKLHSIFDLFLYHDNLISNNFQCTLIQEL